jgi:hypothetical protein
MALRIREDGRILCAAMHPEELGDTYLHDGISYRLTVLYEVIVTEAMEQKTGRGGHAKHGQWWWRDEVPEDVVIEVLPEPPAGEEKPWGTSGYVRILPSESPRKDGGR